MSSKFDILLGRFRKTDLTENDLITSISHFQGNNTILSVDFGTVTSQADVKVDDITLIGAYPNSLIICNPVEFVTGIIFTAIVTDFDTVSIIAQNITADSIIVGEIEINVLCLKQIVTPLLLSASEVKQYEYFEDDNYIYRRGIRDSKIVIDITVTETGFEGTENVDWLNLTSKTYLDGEVSNLLTEPGVAGCKFTWETTTKNEDGFELLYSDDNITFVYYDEVASAVTEFDSDEYINGWFKVRAFKQIGAKRLYSQTSDSISITAIPLETSGDGSGVTTLRFTTSANETILLTGTAKFYDDAGGTTNEGSTRTVTSGAIRTFYMKLPSDTSQLVLFNNYKFTEIGHIHAGAGFTHATNAARITAMDIKYFPANLLSIYIKTTGYVSFTGIITDLPIGLTFLFAEIALTGDYGDLPTVITYYRNSYSKVNDYSTKSWNANMNNFRSTAQDGFGLLKSEISTMLIDFDKVTWISGGTINFLANHEGMSDINQGGIWGDYSAGASPSALAIALKSLSKTKSLTVLLRNITLPGGTGNGSGFPANFGDWWRT